MAVIIGVILLISLVFVPRFRSIVIRLIGYSIFTIAITIRFYVLLPIGLLRAISYFLFGEITDLLSGDSGHPVTKITRKYLPYLFLLQLQRYNGLGDQVPAISVLLLRYLITIVGYMSLGIIYLWLKAEYKFSSITVERVFIVIALGVIINILSSSLYYIISALSRTEIDPVEVKIEEKITLNSSTLYKIGRNKDGARSQYKSNELMNIYKNAAPVLARMQRTDLGLKPFYIAYRKGNEDFYQYEEGFNIVSLIRVVNELPVIDELEGMIDYCIYYKDGKSFHKTDYMTRERLKILAKAVFSIYTGWNKN
jgi:hypothetical protein